MPSLFKNTGEQEVEQVDANPNSPSTGQRRWVVSGLNLTACPIPPPASPQFRSLLILEKVFGDNCVGGDLPDGVNFRIEEGFRTSVISQQAADDSARAYFDANKQAFANANDTCSPDPDAGSYRCETTADGCWTGFILHTIDGRRQYVSQAEYDTCFVATAPNGGPLDMCPAL